MCKSSFFQLFKNTFGVTPNDYIIKERIGLASQIMLESPDKPVSEVAFELGYSESSYFTKQFKAVTGLCPRAYIKFLDKKS